MRANSQIARARAILFLAYALAVLAIDSIALHDQRFRVLPILEPGFDSQKFVLWLVVPLLLSLPNFDYRYFTVSRWKRADWWILGAIAGVGGLAVLVIPHLPGVAEQYRGWGGLPWGRRIDLAGGQLVWILSWLVGYEFLNRYFLLKHLAEAWPRAKWWLVLTLIPAIEGLYHVAQQKPALESLGMAALSVILCAWALHRRSTALPLLAHLAIEIELVVFLMLA